MLGAKSGRPIAPSLDGVQPHRTRDEFWRFPLVAGPDVSVEEVVGVAEDFQVHAPERWVVLTARSFHGLSEQSHALQIGRALRAMQIGQPPRLRVVRQQNAVAGQPLRVAHDSEATGQPGQHGWVLAPKGGADAVLLPVGHGARLLPVLCSPAPRKGSAGSPRSEAAPTGGRQRWGAKGGRRLPHGEVGHCVVAGAELVQDAPAARVGRQDLKSCRE